jgi:predicted MFS family arabinose efflux permease
MIALGIVGGAIGGSLPGWLGGKHAALLLAAGLAATAAWPALRLPAISAAPGPRRGTYPATPFVFRFLAAFALWHLATGSFNPFFNAYFARLGYAAAGIGSLFSASQFAQAVAVLAAPLLIRRLGTTSAVSAAMAATAALLLLLSAASGGPAPLLFIVYMAFQWMSEPGLNVLLMNGVAQGQRANASAMSSLVAFAMQATAALVAGAVIARFGYGTLLAAAAVLAGVAALAFRLVMPANAVESQPRAAAATYAADTRYE